VDGVRAWIAWCAPAIAGALLSLSVGVPVDAAPTTGDARTRLDELYTHAAEQGRRFEAAQRRLASADEAVRRERRAALQAKAELAEQSAAVAALTIQQLQSRPGIEQYSTMLSADGPREYLERSAAYTSTAEAMNSTIDELSARRVVHEAERRRLEAALQSQRSAMASEASARNAINAAIAESKRQTRLAAETNETAIQSRPGRGERQPTVSPPAAGDPPVRPPPVTAPPSASPPSKAPPVIVPPVTAEPPSAEPDGVWDKIAQCESGGNWHINTGNGYYGGLQFSYRTWQSVGGPGYPHEQSREVQIHYAKILQARSGWGQWSCASARFS
jgi:hypothetical protein